MSYRNLNECIRDLEAHGHCKRINREVDPNLEMALIHRRVNAAGGPAIYFPMVKGSPFPAVSNLFGTMERTRFIFRDTLEAVKKVIELKIDPWALLKHPFHFFSTPLTLLHALPGRVSSAPSAMHETGLHSLPQLKCWPRDGGAFITLPQVYTEDPDRPGIRGSNLGMYRVQLSGGDYAPDREAGLHYQLHRGIGVHHATAIRRGEPLKVSVFIGGPPSHSIAAMMPLPEGMTELGLAGMLGGRRFTYTRKNGHLISAEADFCITGTVDPLRTLPEGPFGDHLGYYSMVHGNPVLKVEHVYHREGAVWPFTVVGRPLQEDSIFGELVHELTGPLVPTEIPGLKAIHAVDAAGVHPLMLAVGSERYVPFRSRKPMEILTLANALLGYGQCSLAKYLLIASHEDDPALKVTDIGRFFTHVLQRVRWQKDLHFQTCTTMDTLDYTGSGLNKGSKVVIAAAGEKKRDLPDRLPDSLSLPSGFADPLLVMPGVITVKGPACIDREEARKQQRMFCEHCRESGQLKEFPLIVLVDDSRFAAGNLENFLWVTFTRSDPAGDIDGTNAFIKDKHWGCGDTLVIDARSKPHHAPPLEEDPETVKKVDALGAPGGPLHGII